MESMESMESMEEAWERLFYSLILLSLWIYFESRARRMLAPVPSPAEEWYLAYLASNEGECMEEAVYKNHKNQNFKRGGAISPV